MIGKNFSCNNIGKRRKSDFYETPYSITQQFIDSEKLNKQLHILEPARGNGAITKVFKTNGYQNIIEKDIQIDGYNFLDENTKYDAIITNPPYSLAFDFILKAKELTDYVALLLPLSYLHGKKRYDIIYTDKKFPLSYIYIYTRYPLFGQRLREDGKYNTGMMVYAWFVWNKNCSNIEPAIKWIDNNMFVLRNNDTKN